MIEVLVALAVLSIGLLGTAALQIQSKHANLGSVQRTLASMLVHDMFERMRSNPTMFGVYLADLAPSQKVGESAGTEPSPNCKSASCTPAQLAAHDVWDWEQLLIGANELSGSAKTGGLVLPLACMTGPSGGVAGSYTLAVAWRGETELKGAPSPNPCGLGSGRYDGKSGSDTLRRIVVVTAYLNDK